MFRILNTADVGSGYSAVGPFSPTKGYICSCIRCTQTHRLGDALVSTVSVSRHGI